MRVLKWIFHPVTLLTIVIVVTLYINRHTLFPEFSASPEVMQVTDRVDSAIDTVSETMSTLAEYASSSEQDSRAPSAGAEPAAKPVPPVEQSEPATPPMQVAEPMRNDDLPQVRMERPVEPSSQPEQSEQPAKEAPTVVAKAQGAEEASTDAPAVNAPSEPNGSSSAVNEAKGPGEILQSARVAAWQGDLDRAVVQYRALIAMQPENYDAYGELGNVLLQKRDNRAAAEAYQQAALLLDKAGYPQAAWNVLNIVSRLDRQKAQLLYEALRQQQFDRARRQSTNMQ